MADLTHRVSMRTSCVCYFGGDPTPQLPYALRVSKRMREEHPGRILRICWETNASMHPAWLNPMVRLSLESGGCIKVDLKAWHRSTHQALCGVDNRLVLDNFASLARQFQKRPTPPLLVASTLLVPGYVDEQEVAHLAGFIADLNPDIPYALLAFAPQFELSHFPTTSRKQAEACMEAAQRSGLRNVRLANQHLLDQ
jgi:pyruvate formate lyase activating enzyme